MKSLIFGLTLSLLSAFQTLACSCMCEGDCSFSLVSKSAEFVALVKVISYNDYLDVDIIGHNGKMPYSMTVEIVKKYKGKDSRKSIKIWGDNGAECRPYISNFKIGEYYLIAPNQLGEYKLDGENANDYDFFSCHTDYLEVDLEKQKAFGEFTKSKYKIRLTKFEEQIKE